MHEEEPIYLAPRLAWGAWLAGLAGLFLYLPITSIVGLCSFDVQPLSPSLLGYFVAVFLGVHVILVTPIASLVYPQFSKKMRGSGSEARRVFLVLLLLTPPLLSFVSFRGGLTSLMDAHEALLLVVPPLVLGTLLFEKTDKSYLFSSFVAVAIFIPLFVINDILSPIETPIRYLSRSGGFYFWRTLIPIGLVLGAIMLTRQKKGYGAAPDERADNFATICFVLGLYGLLTQVVLPIVYAMGKGEPIGSLIGIEVWWLGFLLSAYFLKRPSAIAYKCLVAFVGLNFVIGLVELARYVLHRDVSLLWLWWFSTEVLVMATTIWLAYFLKNTATKAYFQGKN